jgi:hypothetical protein
MSKVSTQDPDLQIQLSLVARIRQAAMWYQAAPAEASSDALQSYLASLECLAEHVAAKCRGCRVIPFPAAGSNAFPFTAA